ACPAKPTRCNAWAFRAPYNTLRPFIPGSERMQTAWLLTVASLLALHAPPGGIDTVAGTGKPGHPDGGKATEALLNQPFHCDLDAAGNLYIAEAGNHCIRKLNLKSGVLTTVAGTGGKGHSGDGGPATKAAFNELYAVAVDTNGDLYLVDRLNAV